MENKCFQEQADKNYPPLRLDPQLFIKTILDGLHCPSCPFPKTW